MLYHHHEITYEDIATNIAISNGNNNAEVIIYVQRMTDSVFIKAAPKITDINISKGARMAWITGAP
jgi:hypothetical protein